MRAERAGNTALPSPSCCAMLCSAFAGLFCFGTRIDRTRQPGKLHGGRGSRDAATRTLSEAMSMGAAAGFPSCFTTLRGSQITIRQELKRRNPADKPQRHNEHTPHPLPAHAPGSQNVSTATSPTSEGQWPVFMLANVQSNHATTPQE